MKQLKSPQIDHYDLSVPKPITSPFRSSPFRASSNNAVDPDAHRNKYQPNRIRAPHLDDHLEDEILDGINTHGSFLKSDEEDLVLKRADEAEELLQKWELRNQRKIQESISTKLHEMFRETERLTLVCEENLKSSLEKVSQRANRINEEIVGQQSQQSVSRAAISNAVKGITDKQKSAAEQSTQKLKVFHQQQQEKMETQKRLEKEENDRKQRLEEERLQKNKEEAEAAAATLKLQQEKQRKEEEEKIKAAQSIPTPTTNTTATSIVPSNNNNNGSIINNNSSSSSSSSSSSTGGASQDISPEAQKNLEDKLKIYETVRNTALSLSSDPNIKRQFFPKINLAIQQISNAADQVMKKFGELRALLESVSSNPPVFSYCQDLICTRLLEQGSSQVSSHKASCFGFAAVAVALGAHFPAFKDTLLAYFYKACPYTLPYYPKKLEGQSNAQWMEVLGYKKRVSDGTFESEDSYTARMSGILAIYAAIVQTEIPAINNPHGLPNGWKWLARLLNIKPQKITPTILLTFLEVAGPKLFRTYRRQFLKLLVYIRDVVSRQLPTDPALTRLLLFLDDCERTGAITPLEGANLT